MNNVFSDSVPCPDWVMCGGPGPAGVQILASTELNQAELKVQAERPSIFDPDPRPCAVRQRFFLTAEMRRFTVIDAPDYPTAFQKLFGTWSPEPTTHPAIGHRAAGDPGVTEVSVVRLT